MVPKVIGLHLLGKLISFPQTFASDCKFQQRLLSSASQHNLVKTQIKVKVFITVYISTGNFIFFLQWCLIIVFIVTVNSFASVKECQIISPGVSFCIAVL